MLWFLKREKKGENRHRESGQTKQSEKHPKSNRILKYYSNNKRTLKWKTDEKKDERKEEKKTESHCVKKWKHNFPFASAVPIFHKGIFPSSLLYHTTKKYSWLQWCCVCV